MSQPPPQPPELPSGPPGFPSGPPSLPTGPPALPPGAPVYLPPPASRSLASRPIFWIVLVVGILAFLSFLAAAGFAGYSKVIKRVKEKQAKQEALAELEQLSREQSQTLRKEFDETGGLSSSSEGPLDKLRQALKKSGTGTDGDAAAARAAVTWIEKIGEASKRFEEATAKLDDPAVMDAATLKSKKDIAHRRTVVREFIAANQELAEVFQNSEPYLNTNLRAEGVPPGKLPPMAKGFFDSLRQQNPIVQKIREQDTAYAGILLQWLDLVETEWGSWTVENDVLTFSNQAANETNSKFLADLEAIGAVQEEAQRQMLELQEKNQ